LFTFQAEKITLRSYFPQQVNSNAGSLHPHDFAHDSRATV
jgi:hypothetical protein